MKDRFHLFEVNLASVGYPVDECNDHEQIANQE